MQQLRPSTSHAHASMCTCGGCGTMLPCGRALSQCIADQTCSHLLGWASHSFYVGEWRVNRRDHPRFVIRVSLGRRVFPGTRKNFDNLV
eukprot:6183165-Pleurochrysis_carterae.AAC.3